MKPATCRMALLSLLLISLACGCATITPQSMAKRTGNSTKVDDTKATLTAGLPRLGPIRIPRPGAKAARARREEAETQIGSSIKQRAEETRQASREPQKREATARREEAAWQRDVKAPEVSSKESTSDEMSGELAGFDQVTQALIRAELRDATPDERTQLLQDLRGVSADMVPKILGIRRAALNYKTGGAGETISPTGGYSSSSKDVENLPATQAGLGTNNPWKANYAPPPVGSGTNVNPSVNTQAIDNSSGNNRMGGPTFPTATFPTTPNQTTLPNGMSPEQLAAQVQASTSSFGLTGNGQNPMLSGMSPVQSMGMLFNNSQQGMTQGNQGMIPLTSQTPNSPYVGGLPSAAQNGWSNPTGNYQLSPPLNSTGQTTPVAPNGQQSTNGPGQNLGQQGYGQQNFGQQNSGGQTGGPTIPAAAVSYQNSLATNSQTGPIGNGWANGNLPNYSTLPTAMHSPDWQQHLQGLISAAEAEAALLNPGTTDLEKQRYIEAHVQLRMLYMMAGQQQRALAHIPGIDPADQEFWQQVMWGTTNYFDIRQIPGASDRATQTVAQFQAASSRLREKAHLELRGLNFCNQIYGFGDIEKFAGGNEFTPGTQVLVYAEVSNFKSELGADGRYHSKLKPSYEILRPGGQGQLIEQKNVAPIEDICNNHRQDFYFYIKLSIPEQIAQGPYVLRLTVEDELSHKLSTQTLNFIVK